MEKLEFLNEYRKGLKELTFNSKPIINNLSMIAEENIRFYKEITFAVEERIQEVNNYIK
jgi:pre-mRNA cleavage complex 2 protein Pcf11